MKAESRFVLEIDNLQKKYASPEGVSQMVVDLARLELREGQQLALRGRSGSGKTTLLHLIAGILRPDRGRVSVAGHDMTAAGEAERDRIRAHTIGYIFQTFNLLQGYSALENVELAMSFGRGRDTFAARGLLEKVGLGERMNYRPSQLSTGQQQRVAVARALANAPALVLADEPTGNLDPARSREAVALIRSICRQNKAALLLVSHDREVLGQFDQVKDLEDLCRTGAKEGKR